MSNYIVRNVNNPEDMLLVVHDTVDQSSSVENDNETKDLTNEEKNSEVNVQTQNQKIKLYVTIELGMRINMNNIHDLVWVKFTH